MADLRAKFQCNSVQMYGDKGVEIVWAHAVYGDSEDNKSWSEATPSGQLSMTISNPSAQGVLKVGDEFYLDFTIIKK